MIGGITKSSRLALLAAMGLAGGVVSAQAADLGGNCCADLEERVAELEATTARKGNRKVSLEVSGWVNEAFLFFDDSVERNAYQVTNMVAQTRFRFVGKAAINAKMNAGYLIEIGVNGARSDDVSAFADDSASSTSTANSLSVRHSAWWLEHKDMGKVWVGQTSQSTDGITEISLANTGHFATSNIPAQYGAFNARTAAGGTGPRLNAFMGGTGGSSSGGTDSAQLGEGNRRNLVKYESPALMGFIASASAGEDDFWDVALRYAGEFSGFKLAFGVGYESTTEGTLSGNSERNCVVNAATPSSEVKCQQLGLSGSVMHAPTGLFVTGGYGWRHDDKVTVAGQDSDSTRWWVQGGIEQNFFGIGKTTLFGEYQTWEIGRTNVVNSASASTWGIGLNQSIDAAAMDLYVKYNNTFDLSCTGATATGCAATNGATVKGSFEDFQSVMAGGIIRF